MKTLLVLVLMFFSFNTYSSPASQAAARRRQKISAESANNPSLVTYADGFVQCGNSNDETVEGYGCRVIKRGGFFGSVESNTLYTFRGFLQKENAHADFVGIQVVHWGDKTRVLIFFRNKE